MTVIVSVCSLPCSKCLQSFSSVATVGMLKSSQPPHLVHLNATLSGVRAWMHFTCAAALAQGLDSQLASGAIGRNIINPYHTIDMLCYATLCYAMLCCVRKARAVAGAVGTSTLPSQPDWIHPKYYSWDS